MSDAEQAAPKKPDPTPFEIVDLPHGGKVASNGTNRLLALDAGSTMFRRRAIRRPGTENSERVEWAVIVMGDVRVYFDGTDCIVTKQDMSP